MSRSTKILIVTLILMIDFLASLYIFIYQPTWLIGMLQNNKISKDIFPQITTKQTSATAFTISKLAPYEKTAEAGKILQLGCYYTNSGSPIEVEQKIFAISSNKKTYEIPIDQSKETLLKSVNSENILTTSFTVPLTIPKDIYAFALYIYDINRNKNLGICNFKNINIINQNSYVAINKIVNLEEKADYITQMPLNENQITFEFSSTKNYPVVYPQITVTDNENKIVFENKNLTSFSLDPNAPANFTFDISNLELNSLYKISITINDELYNPIFLSPIYYLHKGTIVTPPNLITVTSKDNQYLVKINEQSFFDNIINNYELGFQLLNAQNQECAYKSFDALSPLPASLELTIQNNCGTPDKINIIAKIKKLNKYLFMENIKI